MAAKKENAATTTPELIEIEVAVDGHKHAGEPVAKGEKIKVSPAVAEMLKKAWATGA